MPFDVDKVDEEYAVNCPCCEEVVHEDDIENGVCHWCLESKHQQQSAVHDV